jgi:hypothetical protein
MADDEIVIPDQVRRQAARAEELQRELAAGREARGDEAQPSTEAVPPLGDDTTIAGTGASPPAPPAGAVEPAAAPPSPPSPPSPAPAAGTEWEQRYRTLQGKYDAETAGYRAQVQGMERLIATMQAPPAPAAPAASAAPPTMTFEQGDIDLYGEDFLQAAARAAAARYEPIIADLNGKIARLEGGQQNLNSQNLQDRVFDQLDKDPEMAGWRAINTSQEFIHWLQGIDEYAGVSRNTMLQHAYSNGDAMRTGRFFKKYMAEHTVAQPPPAPPQTGSGVRPNGNGNGYSASAGGTRLEDLVVPGRAAGGSGGSDGAPQPRIWSRPEISRFYRDRTDGKFRGREQEGDALERDILAAAAEGRIA